MFCFNFDNFLVTKHSINIAWTQISTVFANWWRDFSTARVLVILLNSHGGKKCYILYYVTIHCDFQECNPNIKQGHTIVKFVSITISLKVLFATQIGMRAPLVINSTCMKKIICFIPNVSRFCVSIDFTGTLNANCDFIDL